MVLKMAYWEIRSTLMSLAKNLLMGEGGLRGMEGDVVSFRWSGDKVHKVIARDVRKRRA